jgi:subtilisin family serine protease
LSCDHANCRFWQAVDWPAPESCPVTVAVGLIDTGINPDHDILAGARLSILPRPGAGEEGSGAVHGTAVASLLIGNPASRVPGLIPGAEVLAVDVFTRAAGDERADVATLVEGLDLLAARGVRLINMSLSGPPNTVLERMLDRLTDPAGPDAVIIAAAGNGGPSAEPAWPAAHPAVLAVTAVDARGRVYGRAQRGDHVALAAPGVDLLAATSVRGARGQTGTSFAVPFVTAAAALRLSGAAPMTGASLRADLVAAARDLGAPGKDAVFGHGLLSAATLCAR